MCVYIQLQVGICNVVYVVMPILLSCLWKPKTLHEYSDFGYIRIYTYYFLYYYYSFTQLSNNAQNIIAHIFFLFTFSSFFCGGKVGSNFFDKRSTINRSAWKKNLLLFSSHARVRSDKKRALRARGRSSSAGCHCFYGDQSDH